MGGAGRPFLGDHAVADVEAASREVKVGPAFEDRPAVPSRTSSPSADSPAVWFSKTMSAACIDMIASRSWAFHAWLSRPIASSRLWAESSPTRRGYVREESLTRGSERRNHGRRLHDQADRRVRGDGGERRSHLASPGRPSGPRPSASTSSTSRPVARSRPTTTPATTRRRSSSSSRATARHRRRRRGARGARRAPPPLRPGGEPHDPQQVGRAGSRAAHRSPARERLSGNALGLAGEPASARGYHA